jgi:hypothetical protein
MMCPNNNTSSITTACGYAAKIEISAKRSIGENGDFEGKNAGTLTLTQKY